ncbi:MAG: hypothetical protein GY738_13675, partial [Pseudoalteromonas sp.]|nr:hypothetical protein [Pseudoalteromonas sp.]
MKAESLRLGNYVHFNKSHKELGIVTAISKEIGKDLDMVYLNQRIDNYFLMKHIKPIPLTEEWLLKLGFEKRSDYHKDNIRICLRFNSKHKIGIQSKKV